MKDKKKKTSPSRARYEKDHPTVSCRLPKEMFEDLETVRKNEGKSLADVIKIGLGLLKVKSAKDDDIRNQGIEEGFKAGFSDAKNIYMVVYPCSVCDGMMEVRSAKEKEAIAQYMQEHNWGHDSCHKSH